MGFISSAQTVTVQAFLTAAGKRKLFESLETVNEPFVTKFALGDSDANYVSISEGKGTLSSGVVPEASEFKPSIRSFAVATGKYRPGPAVILMNGRYGGEAWGNFPIAANQRVEAVYQLSTEWPKNYNFSEEYALYPSYPESISDGEFSRFFSWSVSNGEFRLVFAGGMDLSTLQTLIGKDNEGGGSSTFDVKIVGKTSGALAILHIDFVE